MRRRREDGRCTFRSFLIPALRNHERVNDDRWPRPRGHNVRFDTRRKGNGTEAQSSVWFKVSGRRPCSAGFLQLIFFISFKDRFLTDDQDVWSHNAWDRVPPPDDQDEIVAAAMAKQRSLPVPEGEKVKINAKPSRNWYLSWLCICEPHALNVWEFRDNFYKNNANNFFRDRNWCIQSTLHVSSRANQLTLIDRLSIEFPELVATTKVDVRRITLVPVSTDLTRHSIGRPDDSSRDWVWSVAFNLPIYACSQETDTGAGNTVFPLLTMNKNPHLSLRAYDYSPHAIKLVQVRCTPNSSTEVFIDIPA